MNTKRRLLLAIPCLLLAGAASMTIAYVIGAPPVLSFWLGIALFTVIVGRDIWRMRHF